MMNKKAIIITANIQKGGCGKSTTIESLACSLGRRGKKVLVVDLDAQANITFSSGAIESDKTIYNVLKRECDIVDVIQETKYFDIAPADILLSGADIEFNTIGREYIVKRALDPVMDKYDYILIDTPPSLGTLSTNALTACDYVVIPSVPSYYSTKGMIQLFNAIDSVKEYTNPNIKIAGVLLVRYKGYTKGNRTVADIVENVTNHLQTRMFDTRIRECVKVDESQGEQIPLIDYAPKCTTALDYEKLTDELLGVIANDK